MTRAHPVGVGLLAAACVLSIATTPEGPPVHVAEAPDRAGALDLEPGLPAEIVLRFEISCVAPSDVGEPLPIYQWGFDTSVRAQALDGPPDTGVRTHVALEASVDGVVTDTDDAYLGDAEEGLYADAMTPVDDCVLGEPCGFDVVYRLQADAAVHVEWSAWADVTWFEDTGRSCLVFLFEA